MPEAESIASVSTGQPDLDKKLGGGIPLGSLTLLEGQSDSGKSVVSQQLIWGSLQAGLTAVLFTTESTTKSFLRQMSSLNLDVMEFLLLGRLRIYPIAVGRRTSGMMTTSYSSSMMPSTRIQCTTSPSSR